MKQKRNYLKKQIGNKKVGLALGCGYAKGLAHIGVLKLLKEHDIKIDFIAGTSIGAFIGGAFAAGISVDEMEELALNIDLISTVKLFFPGIPKSGIVTGQKVWKLLTSHLGNSKIENLKIPFSAVATDIISGEEKIINEGNLAEAIRASISIPIIFKPVIHENIILVDGGLVNPVPIDTVRKMGAEFIIAVNVLSSSKNKNLNKIEENNDSDDSINSSDILSAYHKKIESLIINHKWLKFFLNRKEHADLPGMKKIFDQSIQITQEKLTELSLKLNKPDILIEPELEFVNRFDYFKAKKIIEKGYESAKNIIEFRESKTKNLSDSIVHFIRFQKKTNSTNY